MKNLDILIMINSGINNITNYDLSAANAYKVMKFRNILVKKYEEIQEKERQILNDVNIDDPQAFDERYKTLNETENRTDEQNAELADLNSKYNA